VLCSFGSMDQKNSNQQGTRKYVGDSAYLGKDEPSKAPRQDEDGSELVGSSQLRPHQVDPNSKEQGISNRPVKDEHAFPESDAQESDAPDSVETTPKQQGGNRGGV
jgi:hypothetical protein